MTWTLQNRPVIVTGATSGIGTSVATQVASAGAKLTITSRNTDRGARVADEITSATGADVTVLPVDFADLESVRRAADMYLESNDELAVLVNNAGIVVGSRTTASNGHELTFTTNHLGPFLFTQMLTDLLVASAPARVINTASVAHTYAKEGIVFDDLDFEHRRYKFMEVYGHSKLANILHARELNRRLGDQGVTAAAVHPGVVRTGLGSGTARIVRIAYTVGGRWMRSPEEGADTIVWLATAPDIDLSDGSYFEDRKPSKSTRHARDDDMAQRLWAVSEELVAAP